MKFSRCAKKQTIGHVGMQPTAFANRALMQGACGLPNNQAQTTKISTSCHQQHAANLPTANAQQDSATAITADTTQHR
jgi:hypothetical protein